MYGSRQVRKGKQQLFLGPQTSEQSRTIEDVVYCNSLSSKNIMAKLNSEEPLQNGIPPLAMNPLWASSYAQWFANEANDSFHTNYAAVLQRFNPINNTVPRYLLLDLAVGNTTVPQAYVMVTMDQRGG